MDDRGATECGWERGRESDAEKGIIILQNLSEIENPEIGRCGGAFVLPISITRRPRVPYQLFDSSDCRLWLKRLRLALPRHQQER